MKFWTFTVTFTLATAIQSSDKTFHLTNMCHHKLNLLAKGSAFPYIKVETVLIDWKSPVFLTLELADQSFRMILWLMMSHSEIWWQGPAVQKISSGQTFAVTLTLNTAIQSFRKILQLKIAYQQTKSSCKRINSSKERVDSFHLQISLHCDLDLEDRKPIFLHDTPAQDDASPHSLIIS